MPEKPIWRYLTFNFRGSKYRLSASAGLMLVMGMSLGLMFFFLTAASPVSALPTTVVTISVDTTNDANTAGYQACTAAANDCSRRGAISKANADAGNDYIITLPAGTYQLTLAGSGEDVNATGDLDFTAVHSVQVNGAGSASTFIQAGSNDSNGIDRVMDVMAGKLTLQDVTILYGQSSDDGGGILYDATLFIQNSDVVTNTAVYGGGASKTGPTSPWITAISVTTRQRTPPMPSAAVSITLQGESCLPPSSR